MDLRTRVGKVPVEGVIGNSPGPRKSIDECHQVGRSPASMIMLGSLTIESREGNAGDVYWSERVPEVALNSLGLPAKRLRDYIDHVGELERYGKPIVVSVAGFTAVEFGTLAKMFSGMGVTIELNMTCPNIEKKGIFAYDLTEVGMALHLVRLAVPTDNLVVKLNYHPDSRYIEAMCDTLINGDVNAVALCNTLPNGLVLDPETLQPVITPNSGLAGQSGSSIRPAVMGQVFQYRRILPPDIDIICEGGIWTGFDILAYFAAGGNFCRIATMYAERGIKAFGELTFQFIEEMEKRGFESLADIPRLEDLPAFQTA
jgi:dihydroorotate dehydrogenase (fumarate)